MFIILDIDGTLLESDYSVSYPQVVSTIRKLSQRGVAFSLNSNRSIEDILPVAKKFGIEGPLVVENGVYYVLAADNYQPQYLVSKETSERFAHDKYEFERELQSILRSKYPQGVHWESVDTVRLISSAERQTYAEGEVVVANNQYRKYTTSAHVYIQRHGKLEKLTDQELGDICEKLEVWCDTRDMVVSKGVGFSNILAGSRETSKTTAVKALREMYPTHTFVSIGNEKGDGAMLQDNGVFYAVANATEDAKSIATYISSYPTSKGVDDILRNILREWDE